MRFIATIDVEDWFHILDSTAVPRLDKWASLPSRIERNFLRLLDIFESHQVPTTCFFLGWVAQRYPQLVREAHDRGHEIASHGYSHALAYQLGRVRFLEDTLRAKKLLENLIGAPVRGYRASGFSVTAATPWFFDCLAEAGHEYDSSVFPGRRAHGGLKHAPIAPYRVATRAGVVHELPVSVASCLGQPVCFFGGGYLRLFPTWLIRNRARRVVESGRPVVFYVHPREIDPGQPRLPLSAWRSFKSYYGLKTTERKLHVLTSGPGWLTCAEYLRNFKTEGESSLVKP